MPGDPKKKRKPETPTAYGKNSEYCSTAEAAELLDVRRPYVTTLIRDGKIEGIRLSPRVYIISRASVKRYLREGRQFRMGGPRNDGSDYRSQHGDGEAN